MGTLIILIFPNFRQGPIYNQTCSRLPIDPTSSILGPPLLILLPHACSTFHRETEGQTIEIIKTLQTPAEYIRLARNTQHFHSCFRARPTAIDCPPHTYLNVHMFVCLYVFICSYVSKTATNIGYWTLMANTSLHHDTESKKIFLATKINFPVTSTTGSEPSLTSYCWTQSSRHFWGGSSTTSQNSTNS